MGRKIFFAQKDKITKEKRREQLEKSGHVFGVYTDKESVREKNKRIPKTKKIYCQAINLWIE
jgi:hypothetical protein